MKKEALKNLMIKIGHFHMENWPNAGYGLLLFILLMALMICFHGIGILLAFIVVMLLNTCLIFYVIDKKEKDNGSN